MKHLKIGLAVAVAAAVLAIGGAGTASATVICKNNLNTEKCSEPYLKGTKGTASNEGWITMTGPFGEIINRCESSTVGGTSVNTGSATETVKSTLTSLTFSKCEHVVEVINPGTGELHWIPGTDNGTLTTSGTTVVVKETLFGDCKFLLSNTDMGTTTGGNPGHLDLKASAPSENCGFNGTLEGSYVATSPTAAWVTSG